LAFSTRESHWWPAAAKPRPDGYIVLLDEKGARIVGDGVYMMGESWSSDYIQLAFRIDKLFQSLIELPFVDYYYGPPEWKAQVQNEQAQEPVALLHAATTLLDTLPTQGFDQHRTTYLSKQVGAMEMVCRKLYGEQFSLEEEMQRLFDLSFSWTPEAQFDEALTLYNEALPGKGDITRRLHKWRRQHAIPWEKSTQLPSLVERILGELRRRTLVFIDLPANESVDLRIEIENSFGGACWYQGNYRSHIEVNIDAFLRMQTHVNVLIDTLCREVYPGHHVAYSLKEQHLYRELGYEEETIGLLFSPSAVIGEGIATSACEMIFSPIELEEWLAENVYPELGIKQDRADVLKIQQAEDLLAGVWGNAIALLRAGHSHEEIKVYLTRYLRQGDVAFWEQPFHEFFGIVEASAKQLMHPWLQGTDRHQVFRRYLMEQFYPSELVK